MEYTFDSFEEVMTHKDSIIREIEENTMPPMGGLADDEREAALSWLTCIVEE